jgi:hypothetical protein
MSELYLEVIIVIRKILLSLINVLVISNLNYYINFLYLKSCD